MTATRAEPGSPTDLGRSSWFGVLKRTVKGYNADQLGDRAAALTYFGILALFPALLALVSILGLVGKGTTQTLINNLGQVTPGSAHKIIVDAVKNLQGQRSTSFILFIAGLAGALWSASGYVGAFIRASNGIYGIEEGRPFYKLRPLQLLVTAVLLVMTSATAIAVVLSGGLAKQAGDLFGLGSTAVRIWGIAKWPVILVVVITMLAILYRSAPNAELPRFRWLTPGGLFAVVIWMIASGLFAFYVANFGSYNKTYGTMGGVIVFLTWLWITNIAVLMGAELNAELERGRELSAGRPAERNLQIPLRDEPKSKR